VNWFLSLFAPYSAMLVRCAALEEKVRMLEDRALAAEARAQDVRLVADAAWRTVCGRSIFGLASEAMPLPPDYTAPQPHQGRRMAREVVAEQGAQAVKDWMKVFEEGMPS
jgi:hypothetical protein